MVTEYSCDPNIYKRIGYYLSTCTLRTRIHNREKFPKGIKAHVTRVSAVVSKFLKIDKLGGSKKLGGQFLAF